MTDMKKNASKSTKSPAPATKVVPAKKVIAPAKPVAPVKSVAPVAKPAAKKKPAATEPAKPAVVAPAVKPVATKPVVTTITAQIDIGFGNALYIRGEGPGLSWDEGLLMNCVSDDQWQIALGESVRPIVFKFLVNDLSWSAGEDYSVASGASVTLQPTF